MVIVMNSKYLNSTIANKKYFSDISHKPEDMIMMSTKEGCIDGHTKNNKENARHEKMVT